MLQYCGHSYAMGNAIDLVKHVVKVVFTSNNEEGVLVTLEKLFGI